MEPTVASPTQASTDTATMFRPPVNRAMRTLDRSFFRKTIPLSAARVFKPSDISKVQKELVKTDLLVLPRISTVQSIKQEDGSVLKALLLREHVKVDGRSLRLHRGRNTDFLVLIGSCR
jgi:tRNA (guanine37-N1)-methyltransferase